MREELADDFDGVLRRLVGQVEAEEPETLLYLVHQGEGGARVLYELYATREAFEEHESKPYVQRFLEQRDSYLSGPPTVESFAAGWGKGWPGGTK